MKIISWGIIFVIIVFTFSFGTRITFNNKMTIMQEEIKYNNAIDQATMDATNELIRNIDIDETSESTGDILNSMKSFFDTFSLSFGYYGGDSKNSVVKMYVPAIITVVNNGFYVYSLENITNGYNQVLEHTLKPKFPFAFNDNTEMLNEYNIEKQADGNPISFTLGSQITLAEPVLVKELETVQAEIGTGMINGKIIGDVDHDGIVTNEEIESIVTIYALAFVLLNNYSIPIPTDLDNFDVNHNELFDLEDIDLLETYYLYGVNGTYEKLSDTPTKQITTGNVVDIRHYEDIKNGNNEIEIETYTNASASYGEIESKKVVYRKSFMFIDGERYLKEEWKEKISTKGYIFTRTKTNILQTRLTEYTLEDYAFTMALRELDPFYKIPGNYLTEGNPENEGFTNPLTGEYEIGEFNKIRKKVIVNLIEEKLAYYVMQHNKYAETYDMTYEFSIPQINNESWNNALSDVGIMAFVQGIPILGEKYYNNFGLSSANIVNREEFYCFDDPTGKIYYSSRAIPKWCDYLIAEHRDELNIYYSAEEAAIAGYYPCVFNEREELIAKLKAM